ncbi:ninjurin-1-like [Brachionichthys hirsutus]|uniref:ninjurin-1-like n=1 Tax=Brachionichthys hirsutus TaxID=412623 RepID=UPI003604559B
MALFSKASHLDAGPDNPAHLNMNHYANRKSAAESMLDVALTMANVTVGVLLIFIVRRNLNDEEKHQRLNFTENCVTGLVFMIVVVNIFIAAFGVRSLLQ